MVFTPPRMPSGQNPTGSSGLSADSARMSISTAGDTGSQCSISLTFRCFGGKVFDQKGRAADDSTGGWRGPVTARSMLARQRQAFILDRVREVGDLHGAVFADPVEDERLTLPSKHRSRCHRSPPSACAVIRRTPLLIEDFAPETPESQRNRTL